MKISFFQNITGIIIIGLWIVFFNEYFTLTVLGTNIFLILMIGSAASFVFSIVTDQTVSKKKFSSQESADKKLYPYILFIFSNFFIASIFVIYASKIPDINSDVFNAMVFCQLMAILVYIILQLKKQYEDFNSVYVKLNDKIREVTDLHSVGMALNSVFELERLLNLILDMIVQILNVEKVTLFLMDVSKKKLMVKIAKGMDADTQKRVVIEVGKGIIGKVAQTGESLLIKNVNDSEFFKKSKTVESQKEKYKNDSFISVPLKVKQEVIGVVSINNKKDGSCFSEEDLEMASLLSSQAAVAIENANLYNTMHETYLETVKALSAAIDAKDAYTAGHSMHVTEYILPIAKEMGLEKEYIEKLEYAGLLHDIGKIGIIESILNKKGRLTDEEFEIIKQHPVIGANIIESIEFLKDVVDLVRYHHERYDGRGYPKGLKGEEIPLGARIIAVADTFDAMTSDRPYRKGLPYQIAIDEIKKCSGSQFDPEIADAFVRIYENGTLILPEREE